MRFFVIIRLLNIVGLDIVFSKKDLLPITKGEESSV